MFCWSAEKAELQGVGLGGGGARVPWISWKAVSCGVRVRGKAERVSEGWAG